MHTKAGKPHAAQFVALELVFAIVERVGVERNLPNPFGADLVDRHGVLVVPAAMEEHDFEGQLRVTPQRALRAVSDVAILIVRERLDTLGKAGVRLLVRCGGQLLGARGDVVQAESRRVRAGQHQRYEDYERAEHGELTGTCHALSNSVRKPRYKQSRPCQPPRRPERLPGICAPTIAKLRRYALDANMRSEYVKH